MSRVQLQEVRLEFHGCTVYGEVNAQNQLSFRLCGHGEEDTDMQDASRVVSWLKERGTVAERPAKCAECRACSHGCFITPREGPLTGQLDELMRAVVAVTHTTGDKARLTFVCAKKQYPFSAEWKYTGGSLGAPGGYDLTDTWTYFADSPTDQVLAAVRSVPGVVRVDVEEIKGRPRKVVDIRISPSRQTPLEDCLKAVTQALAS